MRGGPVGQIVGGLVALFVVSTGAGYAVGAQGRPDPEPASVAAPAPSELPATTATTASPAPSPPPTSPATTPTPTRIVLAGDSVMAGLGPPMKAAVESTGVEVRFVLTPSILRDPAVRFTWEEQLDEFDPEVVVMFVGTWESNVTQQASVDPTWQARYQAEVLDPWIELITSRGARVVWIGNPVVRNDDANIAFAALDESFQALPGRFPGKVTYLDADPALNGDEPGFHDVISLNGTTYRTRQTDGLHLCPDGAALLAQLVLGELAAQDLVDPSEGWEPGTWRQDVVYPADACPAP